MTPRLVIALLIGLVLSDAAPARAAAPVLPQAAEPLQFYVFSFTDTPAPEAAQDVVVGALARDLTVDPAVDGPVTFRADGWYGDEALLQDFGTALLDQDIALMRTGPGAYAVVPAANVPMLMARGGTLMRLPEPATARAPSRPAAAESVSALARPNWWEGALAGLSLFFAGALAGAAALFAGQAVHRRAQARAARPSPPPLRLTDQRLSLASPIDTSDVDPDLVIPTFETRR
ncbi:hypothetical protein [Brevundimonas aurifodinae]|uniref:Uncharacterized protein n=2 Tax=Brevundimonas TaxID=41275 RepID=A0ABV1NQK8_9CAUL|nr:MAG: hypothetical protein B7Z42_05130 [Brevundimonas sp. 12-68-7]OYX33243.1 MAG: hypothetical protein B7Z01_09035 [Brevundimonas subvibrioides]